MFVVAMVFSIWFGDKQKWIAIPHDIFTAFEGIHKGKIETLRISGRETNEYSFIEVNDLDQVLL